MAPQRYTVQIDGEPFDVVVERGGPAERQGRVVVNGRTHTFDVNRVAGTNFLSLLLDGRSLEFLADGDKGRYRITRDTDLYEALVKRQLAGEAATRTGAQAIAELEAVIAAPMTAVVVSVAVKRGDRVARGQPLLVAEAMKMQNELRSPRDGVIKSLSVAPGQRISQGQTLMVVG